MKYPIFRFICAGFVLAGLLAPGGIRAEESGAGYEQLEPSLELVDGVAYLKRPVSIRLMFLNRTSSILTIPGDALGGEGLDIIDDKGRPVEIDPMHQVSQSPDLSIQGYDAGGVEIDLSSFFPQVASKKRQWTVTWSYGPLEANPLIVQIIKPYNAKKDRTALVQTDLGLIKWELLPDAAPEHVKHFVDLARQGFYEGKTLFRYIPGLQLEGGGDADGDGSSGWGNLMHPEISNDLAMQAGLVGALRRRTSMTSDSLFFITLGPSQFMKGVHTFYARVTDGWDAIARVNKVPNKGRTGAIDEFLLLEPVIIQSVIIK